MRITQHAGSMLDWDHQSLRFITVYDGVEEFVARVLVQQAILNSPILEPFGGLLDSRHSFQVSLIGYLREGGDLPVALAYAP